MSKGIAVETALHWVPCADEITFQVWSEDLGFWVRVSYDEAMRILSRRPDYVMENTVFGKPAPRMAFLQPKREAA